MNLQPEALGGASVRNIQQSALKPQSILRCRKAPWDIDRLARKGMVRYRPWPRARRPLVFPPGNVYGGFLRVGRSSARPGWYTRAVRDGGCRRDVVTAVDGPHRGRAKRTSSPSASPVAYSRARERVRPGNYGAIPIRFLCACQRQALTARRNGTVGPQRVIPIAQGPGSAL